MGPPLGSAVVPLWFGPDDEGGFYAASAALVQRYEGMHNDGLGWIVEQILEFKWMYLDGNLVTWTQADIDTILFEVYPAKSLINPADQGDVIRGFAGLLRFLATMPLGGNESELERVAGHVEQSAAEFELAMADRDRFSLGKRLTAAMVAEGVDLGDQEAMDRWVAEFNGRSYEERGRGAGAVRRAVAGTWEAAKQAAGRGTFAAFAAGRTRLRTGARRGGV